MKKKSFLNGLYAKGALALTIVAGFTLAGCEKEDFNVNVPDINITVPEVDLGEGVFVECYISKWKYFGGCNFHGCKWKCP